MIGMENNEQKHTFYIHCARLNVCVFECDFGCKISADLGGHPRLLAFANLFLHSSFFCICVESHCIAFWSTTTFIDHTQLCLFHCLQPSLLCLSECSKCCTIQLNQSVAFFLVVASNLIHLVLV